MKCSFGTLIVLATTVVAGGLRAQSNADWEIVSSFPLAATHAVASDPTEDVVYMGSGSGFIALEGSADQPEPLTGASIDDFQARCRGFVRDIVVEDDYVWVAAGVGGLQRWERATNTLNLQVDLDDGTGEYSHAWSVAVAHDPVSGFDYAVVGSNELGVGGKVFLVEVQPTGDVFIRDFEDFGTPIYAVAASFTLSSNILSVLVGKACDPVPGNWST